MLSVHGLISRAQDNWRRLPADWRILVAWNVLAIVVPPAYAALSITGLNEGHRYYPLGPFVVEASGADIYRFTGVLIVAIETVGLLTLARWAWGFGFVRHSIELASLIASAASGAFLRANEMSGVPIHEEGFAFGLGALLGALFPLYCGVLVWRILRRRALREVIEAYRSAETRES